MKSNLFFMTFALALSTSALAELRPTLPGGGEIRDTACGILNRSVTICLAQAAKTKEFYLVKKTFLPAARNPVVYVPVTYKKTSRTNVVGSVSGDYTGRAAVFQADGKTVSENTYLLKTATVIVRNPKLKAHLFVNGVSEGPTIEMEAINHSQ